MELKSKTSIIVGSVIPILSVVFITLLVMFAVLIALPLFSWPNEVDYGSAADSC